MKHKMLVGYDRRETWPRIFERFDKMTARGIKPYPMVYDIRDRDAAHWRRLKQFQRWAVWVSAFAVLIAGDEDEEEPEGHPVAPA